QDHRKILNLLAEMERSPRGAVAERTELLLRLKRQLTAHALAEEDVVYPLLHDRAGQVSDTKRLYREHADMKMHLFRLEQTPKDDPRWIDTLREVRALIAEHIEQEEEVDFPTLRSLLDSQDRARLSGGVQREKSFVL
ncbi:MAG TPA: hemerythrin domain-containing protein, partial [Alphaproteobacteria bacterium]|nr:hemerythrin domain-containing protein [Alphaproteobacteria bacterium]